MRCSAREGGTGAREARGEAALRPARAGGRPLRAAPRAPEVSPTRRRAPRCTLEPRGTRAEARGRAGGRPDDSSYEPPHLGQAAPCPDRHGVVRRRNPGQRLPRRDLSQDRARCAQRSSMRCSVREGGTGAREARGESAPRPAHAGGRPLRAAPRANEVSPTRRRASRCTLEPLGTRAEARGRAGGRPDDSSYEPPHLGQAAPGPDRHGVVRRRNPGQRLPRRDLI
jgi:hypothetical protein